MRSGPKPSLTERQVRALRRLMRFRRATGRNNSGSPWVKQIARKLRVGPDTVRLAAHGYTYRWVS